jgi:hypothetical protein
MAMNNPMELPIDPPEFDLGSEQRNFTDYQQMIEDRKAWNRTIANFDKSVEKCKTCGGPMEQTMMSDEVNGVEYFNLCKNPDCPDKQ